jgi:hypothetical protein
MFNQIVNSVSASQIDAQKFVSTNIAAAIYSGMTSLKQLPINIQSAQISDV